MTRKTNTIRGMVLGLAGLVYGCAPMTPEETKTSQERMLMLPLLYAPLNNNLTPKQQFASSVTGNLIKDYDVAREGRSNLTVNVSQAQPTREYTDAERDEAMRRLLAVKGIDADVAFGFKKKEIPREKYIEDFKKYTNPDYVDVSNLDNDSEKIEENQVETDTSAEKKPKSIYQEAFEKYQKGNRGN